MFEKFIAQILIKNAFISTVPKSGGKKGSMLREKILPVTTVYIFRGTKIKNMSLF